MPDGLFLKKTKEGVRAGIDILPRGHRATAPDHGANMPYGTFGDILFVNPGKLAYLCGINQKPTTCTR